MSVMTRVTLGPGIVLYVCTGLAVTSVVPSPKSQNQLTGSVLRSVNVTVQGMQPESGVKLKSAAASYTVIKSVKIKLFLQPL